MWLLAQCPFCDREILPGSIFCDQCGHQLSGIAFGAATSGAASSLPETVQASVPVRSTAGKPEPETDGTERRARTVDRDNAAERGLQQYIPSELLDKLDAARAAGGMVGERRIVSILFCDVKGSTAAAETLDPEEWTEIINGAFDYMIRPVYEYEGLVARLMGDSILAFFGAPIAHEDDPQRAVLAGLDIVQGIQVYREQVKQDWDWDFDVRIGINTGMVVVGAVGSDLRMEYTALGDAINVAARMEQTAEPGTVQIAEATYRQIAPLFNVRDLGGVEMKGKAEAVPAFRVISCKATGGSLRGIEGLHAEIVGRDAELETGRAVLKDLQQGVGRIVCLLGEAGLGKSRIVHELKSGRSRQIRTMHRFGSCHIAFRTRQRNRTVYSNVSSNNGQTLSGMSRYLLSQRSSQNLPRQLARSNTSKFFKHCADCLELRRK